MAIPDDAIIQYSHLAKKEELAQRIRTMTGQEPPTEEHAEAMAIQQELAMQQVQLELAKMEAEVQKLQSDTAVNMSKVQDMAQVQPQMKLAELQSKIQMKQEELELRRQLSAATNQVRTNQQNTSAAARIAATAMQTAAKKPAQTDIPNMRTPENLPN